MVCFEPAIYTKFTKIEEFVCPPNISETVAVRTVKLAHRPHNCLDTIKLISKLILLSRKYHIRNVTIREKAHIKPINTFLMKKRLSWFGHVQRRDEDNIAKSVLNTRIDRSRPRGRPKLRWMDRLKDMKKNNKIRPEGKKSSLYYICILFWSH